MIFIQYAWGETTFRSIKLDSCSPCGQGRLLSFRKGGSAAREKYSPGIGVFLLVNYVTITQLSTQAFSSRSLDLARNAMAWRHISRQVEWAGGECLGTRLTITTSCSVLRSVGLSDVWEEWQDVVNGDFKVDHGSRVTALNEIFKVLVLLNKLLLHRVPYNLKWCSNNLESW